MNINDASEDIRRIFGELSRRYIVEEREVHVDGATICMLTVHDTNALLEQIDAQSFAADERLPYWAELWASSLVLARYCLTNSSLRGASVLELGCGLGLVGIAAALGGARVVMTDYEEDALHFARYNVLRNLPCALGNGRVELRLMDWRAPERIGPFDYILGSDLVYERRNFLPLIRTLTLMLASDGLAVFTDPDRSIAVDFFDLASAHGFALHRSEEREQRDGVHRTIALYELRHRKESHA